MSESSGYYLDGEEIVIGRRRGRPLKAKHHNPTWFPQQTKVDACVQYAVYGDYQIVSDNTGVPIVTLKTWHEEPWWVEIQKKVYIEQNENLVGRINSVLDHTIEQIAERLEHGDHVVTNKGTVVVKPVDAKVLASLFNNLSAKRQLIRGEPTQISGKVGVDDRLNTLAKQFERFSKAKEIEGEYNAVTEGVQEELQTGASDSDSEGRGQGQGHEEQGEETCDEETWEDSLEG
jgi:hypothetical protein